MSDICPDPIGSAELRHLSYLTKLSLLHIMAEETF
jgi:hypothetical protein